MTTKKMLYNHLKSKGCFSKNLPGVLQQGVGTVSTNASHKMKLMMVVTELVVFVSQLRKPILLPDGTLVTINIITFILARSGLAKDSSMNMIRKTLRPAYKLIDANRVENAKELAKRKAIREGAQETDWIKFYSKPRDLFGGIGSLEGQMKHLAGLEEGSLGAGYIQVSELGSELQSNKDIAPNIVALAIGYDVGQIPTKIIKSDENQVEAIKALPFSGLFFGSQDNILYDEAVKRKFKDEFSTKLSRRSDVNYNIEIPVNKQYATIAELLKDKKTIETNAKKAQDQLEPAMTALVNTTTHEPLTLSESAVELYETYKEYCDLESQEMSKLHPIATLARKHMHWKTLKRAGAFAILRGHTTIEELDFMQSVNFSEMFANDLSDFETELSKEYYEMFCDYMHAIADHGKAEISMHSLRKLGYVSSSGSIIPKMKELVKLASAYDIDGIYTLEENKILFEQIVRTDVIGASFVLTDNSELQEAISNKADKDIVTALKQKVSYTAVYGYAYSEVRFNDLSNLLTTDCAFTPFRLKAPNTEAIYDTDKHPNAHGGIRGKDNTYGPCKWICLDVDTSTITDEEAHMMLTSINHHIARTSDPDNPFKFRVIIELDSEVEINSRIWRKFLKSIGEFLSLQIDLLPQSQITYGYAGRNVLSVIDQYPIEAKPHRLIAQSEEDAHPSFDASKLTVKQRSTALDSKMATFGGAFEAPYGEGSRRLIGAAMKAKELGATNDWIINLMHEINNYWDSSMEETRLDKTILAQIRRW